MFKPSTETLCCLENNPEEDLVVCPLDWVHEPGVKGVDQHKLQPKTKLKNKPNTQKRKENDNSQKLKVTMRCDDGYECAHR